MFRARYFILPVAMIAAGCMGDKITPYINDGSQTGDEGDTQTIITEEGRDDAEEGEDDISATNFDRTITITWSSTGATVTGDENKIAAVSGGNVTIDNTAFSEKIRYELSGSSSNGSLKIYSKNKQALILNGLSLTNPNGAAINNQGKKRCFVVVKGANSLADGPTYTYTGDEDEKAAFFSEGQLIFSGDGSLTVTATGKAAITSDDYVRVMASPSITVSSSAGHGIRGKDFITISDGTINATVSAAGKKGFSSDSLVCITGGTTTIKVTGGVLTEKTSSGTTDYSGAAGIKADQVFEMSGGEVNIESTGAGGKGIKVGGNNIDRIPLPNPVRISGGTLNIKVTGTNYTSGDVSAKGFKVGWAVKSGHSYSAMAGNMIMTGGKVSVSSTNAEAIEVKRELTVSGGELYGTSSKDDAINCASTFTVNDGMVCGISSGNDGLDSNGNFYIKGGVVYAAGKTSPELGIDANTEGGFKLYVQGGTIFAIGGLENGASLTQSCYQASSWTKSSNYAMTVGSDTYIFKTPSSGGTSLVVSGASQPTLKSGVSVSGGDSHCGGNITTGATVTGGSSVSTSAYSGGNGGGGGGGGRPPR